MRAAGRKSVVITNIYAGGRARFTRRGRLLPAARVAMTEEGRAAKVIDRIQLFSRMSCGEPLWRTGEDGV